MKTCTRCGLDKVPRDFYKRNDRLSSWCRLCHREYQRGRGTSRKTLAVPADLHAALRASADRNQMPLTALVQNVLTEHLDRQCQTVGCLALNTVATPLCFDCHKAAREVSK